MPKQTQPNFVLDVEKSELQIQAGLQDRVVQVSYKYTVWLHYIAIQMFVQVNLVPM